MLMNMFTGQDIRKIRVALGLSMKELGEMLGGISESTVSRWESNERHPRFATLVKLNELAKKANKNGAVLTG